MERFLPTRRRALNRTVTAHPVALGLAIPPLVAAGLVPLRSTVSSSNLALGMMVVVVLVAMLGHVRAAIAAAIAGALAFDFFLTVPYGSFAIHAVDDIVSAAILLVGGVAVGQLAARLRVQHHTRTAREDELGRVYYVAELSAMATPVDRLALVAANEIQDLLSLRGCTYESGPADHPTAVIDHEGVLRMGDLEWDVATNGLPGGPLEIEVQSAGSVIGRFVLDPVPGTPVQAYQLLVAVTLADQVAAAAGRWPTVLTA